MWRQNIHSKRVWHKILVINKLAPEDVPGLCLLLRGMRVWKSGFATLYTPAFGAAGKQIPHSASLRAGSSGMTTRKARTKAKRSAKAEANANADARVSPLPPRRSGYGRDDAVLGDFAVVGTPNGCAQLGIWFGVLEGALILLCQEKHAETSGYYDCGCRVAGEL